MSSFWLTVLSIVWLVTSGVLVGMTNAYLDYTSPFVNIPIGQRSRVHDPLLEAMHFLFIKLHLPQKLPDMLVSLAPVIIGVRVVCGGHNKWVLLRRACWMIGAGYLMRVPFTLMTVLPNSNLDCHINPNPNFFLYSLELTLQLKKSCGDVVFSGHTVMFMSACLLWHHNPLKGWARWINSIVWIYSTAGISPLIAATSHYTIDCVLSMAFMLFVWKLYHFALYNDSMRTTNISWIIHHLDGCPKLHYSRLAISEAADYYS
ncbi:hypothetical protein DSO57_1027474 [Entomophthora muscae]|uniref:Uncharacterized protein n=1 Tax=Entomophthora muscae TaxID=34485 RepID=A0ACC2SEN7_9FUNG|nr:hypothetical protein DSO57_1027474 [Entomophthora muscae]